MNSGFKVRPANSTIYIYIYIWRQYFLDVLVVLLAVDKKKSLNNQYKFQNLSQLQRDKKYKYI